MQPTTQDIPGTPCLPMTGRYREVYTDWIARGYPHWRAEWEAELLNRVEEFATRPSRAALSSAAEGR